MSRIEETSPHIIAIRIWFANADVLTQDKLQELKSRIEETPPHIIAIRIWFANADVLTQDKLQELKSRIEETPPHIIAIQEVKAKNFKNEVNHAQYSIGLSVYDMETVNISEDISRGMILYIDSSLSYKMLGIE